MDFIPTTNLKILRNVPLDSTYKDTLTFENKTDQYLYFAGKAKVSFDDFTFQRLNSSVRVPTDPNSLYDCNYIMFQNENFGDKWFYAFIKEVNYMNPNVSEIVFEIDVMQTWYFSYNIKPCFVEREHVNNDNLFQNLVPENLDYGDNIVTYTTMYDYKEMVIVMAFARSEESTSKGELIDGVYSGLDYLYFQTTPTDIERLNNLIDAFATAGKLDYIVSIFMLPLEFVTGQTKSFNYKREYNSIDGYRPKNKKLFTFPYTYFALNNCAGSEAQYKYEYFTDAHNVRFEIDSTFNMAANAICSPLNYKGIEKNWDEGLVLSNFPQCSWTSNAYANWYAMNRFSIKQGFFSSGAGVIAGAASLNIGSAISGVDSIFSKVAQLQDKQTAPYQIQGQTACDVSNVKWGRLGYEIKNYGIKAEFAKIIDDYFSMFGYKVNAVKVPNITGRRSWNFVKTINSVITGSLPVDAMSKIRGILDAGITFWHGDYVGNYDRDNSILNPPPTPDPDPDPDPDPPVEGFNYPFNGSYPVTSFFGWRDYPADPYHTGVDFATPLNTSILASKSGTVTAVITSTTGFGKHIKIDCGDGFETLYAHLNSFNVSVGDVVTQGQLIAKSGNTGLSTGPHLHFQINKDGTPVDPFNYLP